MSQTTRPFSTLRVESDKDGSHQIRVDKIDRVVVEAPLTIVLGDQVLATTMRTPGHDLDLAAGWLVSEAGLTNASQITSMRAFAGSSRLRAVGTDFEVDAEDISEKEVDTVRVALSSDVTPPRPRAYITSSSCGVCSADVLDEFKSPVAPLHTAKWRFDPRHALHFVEQMRSRQKMFDMTGALHAAALVGPGNEVLFVREDVGRHNAVDKVIGHALTSELLPLTDHILVVSGRVSYEIVAKALTASIGAIVAVSGPTSLAVELARQHDQLLIGFAREGRMNIYSGQEWVAA
jgi:FdhD protein